jgi:glyoxylase-like metal-dependent hydrolase (beta-lactamase superfamily II)
VIERFWIIHGQSMCLSANAELTEMCTCVPRPSGQWGVDTVTDLSDDVYVIDTRMGGHHGITASYLIRGSRPCLVETGTALSAPTVIDSLAHLGIQAHDLATIVVTHIHLDHAGGVGDLARAFPQARIVVHEAGARHLVNPERLVASARQVFGPAMDAMFGPLLPTPAERLDILGDIGSIDLGDGRQLQAFHNPGHARHHVGLVDSHTGDLYTGDAAGVFIPELAEVRPATPPPDFDLDLALASLDHMAAVQAQRLLFSHYGPVSNVTQVLEESREELISWVETTAQAYHAGMDIEHAIAMVMEKDRERHPALYADLEVSEKFEELSSSRANVHGIYRWLDTSASTSPGSSK